MTSDKSLNNQLETIKKHIIFLVKVKPKMPLDVGKAHRTAELTINQI